jgi:ABC-2 type transport system ATP-binding protein
MVEMLIYAENISKSFGKNNVLKNVSFQIRDAELNGLVGENGTGKSTLLKIIVGLLNSDSGSFKVEGKRGYCPQEQLLFERLTVRENFIYFAQAYNIKSPRNGFEANLNNILREFNFINVKNKIVSELSGGTKQKLNLALALIHNPDVLILDEPYSGFDWETYLHFWEITERLRAEGKSIFIVSHLIHDQEKFNRIYKLHNGELKCV